MTGKIGKIGNIGIMIGKIGEIGIIRNIGIFTGKNRNYRNLQDSGYVCGNTARGPLMLSSFHNDFV